jgi:tetratricopeptide (TPR) repeat protein
MSTPGAAALTLTLTPAQRPGRFTLSWDTTSYPIELRPDIDGTLRDLLRRLRPALSGGRDLSAKLAPDELLRACGVRLWQALLPDTAPREAREILERALQSSATPLLFALPRELAPLPWELLCDPRAADDTGFVARRRPFVRLLVGGSELPPLAPPLRVLLLISAPPGLEASRRIDSESERAAVESATREFREAGLLHLLIEDVVTPRRVQQDLLRFKPHILHYIGHGNTSEEAGGYLEWESEQGEVFQMFDTRLADLLRPRGLRAVLLHGCKTTGNDEAYPQLQSVAGALLEAGIPAVLAQQGTFTYASSQLASQIMYTALVQEMGLADATFEMRQALAQADRPDWAVPTLYATRAGLAPLFDGAVSTTLPDPRLTHHGAAADLPAPTNTFVGRQPELRALRAMLESVPGAGPVLALIIGPPGVGKSTLAAQAVIRYGGPYKGALTLNCTGYQGMDLFLHRLGAFLKRRESALLAERILPDPALSLEAKIEQAIEELNKAGPFILILDNLESVQRPDRSLTDSLLQVFLQKALINLQGGRILLTGRSQVEGFLPQGKFAANLLMLHLDDLNEREIHQLLERHQPLAHLTAGVRGELVREFGGFPYIYDLLSSRAAVENLADLIHDAQGRITREHQTRAAAEWEQMRQHIIEFATLEATTARLPEATRTLLPKLGLFRLPFPQQALERGLSATSIDWQPLVDWGLLRYDPVQKTYRLHSITAHYARTLLTPQDRSTIQKQIASWYENYATNESHLLNDYLEAHRLLREEGDVEQASVLALRLTDALHRFGLYQLLRTLCTTVIRDLKDHPAKLTAEALTALGLVAEAEGKYQEARRLHQEALAILEQLGDQRGRATLFHNLGALAYQQGDYDEARRLYRESLLLKEQEGVKGRKAATLTGLGRLAYEQGRRAEARQLYEEALDDLNKDDEHLLGTLLQLTGIVSQTEGKLEMARQLYEQALATFQQLGDRAGEASLLHQFGTFYQDQGKYEEAQRFYQHALTIFEQLGHQMDRAGTLHELGNIAYQQGHYDEARALYHESLAAAEKLGNQDARATTLYQLGTVAREQGKYQEAHQYYQESLIIAERLDRPEGQARILGQLGIIAREQGDYQEARHCYETALAMLQQLNDQHGIAIMTFQLGVIEQKQGAHKEARRYYQRALTLFQSIGDQGAVADALGQLGIIAMLQGDHTRAWRLHQEALATFERLGLEQKRALALHELGNVAYNQGKYDVARQYSEESLALRERLGDQSGRAMSLGQLAMIAAAQEEYSKALSLYENCLEIFGQLGHLPEYALTLYQLGLLARQQSDYPRAFQYVEQARALLEHVHSPYLELVNETIAELRAEMSENMPPAYEQESFDTESEDEEQGPPLTTRDLLPVVQELMTNRSESERREFADVLVEWRQSLPGEETALNGFLGYLIAVLRAEPADPLTLDEPYLTYWREFQKTISFNGDY